MKNLNTSKENIKKILLFLIILIFCFLLGYFTSIGLVHVEEAGFNLNSMMLEFGHRLGRALPFVHTGFSVVFFCIALMYYFKCKRLYHSVNEDETIYDVIEHKLNFPILAGNIMSILNIMFLSICLWHYKTQEQEGMELFVLIVFFLTCIWIFCLEKKVIDFEKQLNPEKKGDIYDIHFKQKWIGSMDEAQKKNMMEAGYHSFQAGIYTCMILWCVLFALMITFDTGVLPLISVCIVWLIMNFVYTYMGMRLEK